MKKKFDSLFRMRVAILFAAVLMLLSISQSCVAERESSGLMVVEHKVKTGNSERVARGYIDSTGTLKFGGFKKAEDFSEGLAWVLPDEEGNYNNHGVINTSGQMVIAPGEFSNFKAFSCGMAKVELRKANGYHFIDKSGKIVLSDYSSAESFSFDRALVKKDNQEFFIDKAGNRLFKDKNYYYIEAFSDGLAVVRIKDNNSSLPPYAFIDTSGEVVIDMRKSGIKNYGQPQRFSEGLAAVKYRIKDYEYGIAFINKSGKVAFDIGDRFSEAYPFSDGMAAVKERASEKWGYVNKSGQVVLPPIYSKNIDSFYEGRALVSMPETPTKFGYIDKTGKFIYGPEDGSYTSIGSREWLFHETTCRFKGGMASYIGKVINLSGQIIWPNDKSTTTVAPPAKITPPKVVSKPNNSGGAKTPAQQPSSNDNPGQPPRQSSFYSIDGEWESNWGTIVFKHDSNPVNTELISLSGDWFMGAGKSTFTGIYNSKTHEANFTYEMPWYNTKGTASLKFDPSKNTFSGKYFEAGGSGEMTGKRTSPPQASQQVSANASSVAQNQSAFYDINGEWNSNWGTIVFRHDSNPVNTELISLSGDWFMGAGKSTFTGIYNSKTHQANFSYEMPWYKTKGTASLNFDPGKNTFSGKYFEDSGSGDMTGSRK